MESHLHIHDEKCAAVHAQTQMIVQKTGHDAEIKRPYVPSRNGPQPAVRQKPQPYVTQYVKNSVYVPTKNPRRISEKDLTERQFDYKEAMGTRILQNQDYYGIDNRYFATTRGLKTQDELGHFTWKDRYIHDRERICAHREDNASDCRQRDSSAAVFNSRELYESSRRLGLSGDGVKAMLDSGYRDDGKWE